MLRKITLCLGVLITLTFTLVGCGKSLEQKAAEKYIEGVTGAEVDLNNDGFEITDQEGNTISAQSGKGLPSGWPANVSYYKKGKIEQSSSMALPQGKNYAIVISSNDSIEDIMDYYKSEFSSGWKVDMEMNVGDAATLMLSKDGTTVTIGIDSETGEISQTVLTNLE